MRAYSQDLRQKIVTALQRGMPKAQAATTFDVSLSSVKRYARMATDGDSLAPRKGGGRPPKIDDNTIKLLEEDIKERPEATISERLTFAEYLTGKTLSEATLKRLLKRLGYSRKKGVWGLWSGMNSREQPGE